MLRKILVLLALLTGPGIVRAELSWDAMKPIPPAPQQAEQPGLAGPFAGIHADTLLVAGGANFPKPIWESDKVWHDQVYALSLTKKDAEWQHAGTLPRPVAYGASVDLPEGVLCMGGNDGKEMFSDVFLMSWESGAVKYTAYPQLPAPCAYGQAAMIGHTVYLAGGQTENGLDSAMDQLWSLDLSKKDHPSEFVWKVLPACPGGARAFNIVVTQHNGFNDILYVISGRREEAGKVIFLRDVWAFDPVTSSWQERCSVPRCVTAGTGAALGQSHIYILGGADGSLFFKANELKNDHPGFPRGVLRYHTISDRWSTDGEMPANHVTTSALKWGNTIILPSGEVRPRVRTAAVWRITNTARSRSFGTVNYCVLVGYLLAMVGVGVYFARRNKNTDEFFRGGKSIPWWAAGCSIFATMLSSLTYTGIPSKAYAQDWAYIVGNMMIPVVAFFAVFVVLPFFRRIDATSAYEYLEKRFSLPVRLFGSVSFTLFHLFRMAVVMSLTGLALAVATPLTPTQSVLLMGGLSIIYCTMGGIEAVIWTDTIQTFVLLGGAMLAFVLLVGGLDDGFDGFMAAGRADDKFHAINMHWDATNTQIALWVIVLGAIGQNVSSYSADQAVVQRYMTTSSQKMAARSIWTNAFLCIPASILFFAIGTGLYAFYQNHPQSLDATITADQIFPYFIASELPIGLAGLIVAGIFAAAQSTVSTSMNSTSSSIVTDLMRPFNACKTERGYLFSARLSTVCMGGLGTLLGLVFVDPEIKSLFDQFVKVIGLFMGVLGGLFLLGIFTRRANGPGALAGALIGAAVMFVLWRFTSLNGYLYTTCGISSCFVSGYLLSFVFPSSKIVPEGLTIHSLRFK